MTQMSRKQLERTNSWTIQEKHTRKLPSLMKLGLLSNFYGRYIQTQVIQQNTCFSSVFVCNTETACFGCSNAYWLAMSWRAHSVVAAKLQELARTASNVLLP